MINAARGLSLAALLVFAGPLAAQTATATATTTVALDSEVAGIIEEGLQRSQVMDHLDHLVNRIGPRLSSSDRLTQACEWAVRQFQAMGLDARMEKWGEFPVGFNRGPWFGRMVSPEERALTFGTPAWSPGTKGRQKAEVVLGPRTAEELEAAQGTLAGKWVLEPPTTPRSLRRPEDRKNKLEKEEYLDGAIRRRLGAFYDQEKVLGVIRTSGDSLVRTSGNYRISWDALPTLVTINVIDDDWHAIYARLKAGETTELEFDIRNNFKKGPIPLYNVIADLEGSEKPDEYVIVGGHIDSWDGATGTTDNGTGCSTTLEAARILTTLGIKPRRTIRFMLWSAEEQGLLGSRAYVAAHLELMEKISAVFVHDMGTNPAVGLGCTRHQLEDFEKIFAPVKDLDPEMPFGLSVREGLGGGGGSDHASFLAKGVPAFFWSQKGRSVYGYGWHTQNDTYDIAIPDYQKHTATVVAIAARGVANLDHLLSRKEMQSSSGARGNRSSRRSLGVMLDSGTLKVDSVVTDSTAAKTGIKPGDVIVAIDGNPVQDRRDLGRFMNRGQPPKTLTVLRDGKKLDLKLGLRMR